MDWPLLLLFVAINLLVAINAVWHHPKIGYDVVHNLTYIQVLSHRVPHPTDTPEFYSPPLPFFLPALFDRVCTANDPGPLERFDNFYTSWACRTTDGKFAQALNVLLSIGTTLLLLVISQWIRPDNRYYKLSVLLLLANLTVYYKTFAQVRGEPYVVFFATLSVFLIMRLIKTSIFNWKLVILTGISLGCLILSRQWGFFIFPAMGILLVVVYLRNHVGFTILAKELIVSGTIGLVVGGFFYFHLYIDNGSVSAFTIEHPTYPSLGKAYSLLRRTHLGNFELFREPVRPAFTGAVLPIMYSEIWGDYWGYFTYIKPNSSYGDNGYANADTFVAYLGRVNLVSVPTTLLLLTGIVAAIVEVLRFPRSANLEREYAVFVSLVVIAMLLGFSWFVYSYVLASTKVLKATYVLQGLVLLVIPASGAIEAIRAKWHVAYLLIIAILVGAFLHNIPAMITRYNVFAFW